MWRLSSLVLVTRHVAAGCGGTVTGGWSGALSNWGTGHKGPTLGLLAPWPWANNIVGKFLQLRPVVAATIAATCLKMAFLKISRQLRGSSHGMAIQEEKKPSRLYLCTAECGGLSPRGVWESWELWRCGV
jgi:hypothetical protein